jgi:hypothetical protein
MVLDGCAQDRGLFAAYKSSTAAQDNSVGQMVNGNGQHVESSWGLRRFHLGQIRLNMLGEKKAKINR